MAHQEQYSQSMGPPQSPPIPIDPQLSMYPNYYPGNYQQTTPQHLQHLTLPPNYSSPSSQGSEYIGTPPADHVQASSSNGKRPASVVSNGTPDENRKRPRKDDEPEHSAEPGKEEPTKVKSTRGSRACTVCRRLKMKCVGAEQGGPCKRCQAGGHACIFEESNRGKRSSKKHEILTRSLRKMERTLDTVLKSIGNPSIVSGMVSRSPSPSDPISSTSALIAASPESPAMSQSPSFQNPQPGSPKLHSLPDNTLNPLGLLAEASLSNRRSQGTNSPLIGRSTEDENQPKIGVASDNYFKPGPMTILPLRRLFIERQIQPEMLTFVTTEEVVSLFNIFFDNISMHCNLLDRNFHTPSLVCSRSPFLLTTICSIASKFYTPKPELHTRLTELAKKLAFSVPAQGYKSVEIVQAYLLLTLWGCGAVERYEQDKTWLLLGMAIRMATDLNLHRKTAVSSEGTQEGKARDMEVHNRERTWILCYCLDRSLSAQMGKPHSIKEDAIIRNASKWCHGAMASSTDPSLTAYCELQRILSRCLDFLYSGTETSSGLQQHCDYMLTIKTFEAQVNGWLETWVADRRWPIGEPRIIEYKKLISQFYYNYAMLVLNSFGLQNAMENSPVDLGHFFARCHTSATICATLVRDSLGPKGFMRYAPDSHFVMTSYAVVSLLKLVRPEFQVFMDNEQKTLHLVQDTANTLEQVAVNSSHTPALYSAFIRALLTAKIDANRESSLSNHVNGDPTLAADSLPYPDARQSQADAYNAQPPHYGTDLLLNGFQFESEMGPVADITTFPPTMAPAPSEDSMGSLTMDNILSSGFWDSVLVPGYNSMDGLTGGFLFGVGGSGLITPRMGLSPMQSGNNTPARGGPHNSLTQSSINAAFGNQLKNEGISPDS